MTENTANSAEPAAKAELLNYLRSSGALSAGAVVTTELVMDKQTVRADMVLVSRSQMHCFEIKTKKDTLLRLDKQVDVYSRHADYVTVVADTKHVNAVMSRVPSYVGVYELLSVSALRVVREASHSPQLDPDAMLSVLPVSDLKERLLIKASRREEALSLAKAIAADTKKAAVLEFVRERYAPTTKALLCAARRRPIQAKDLVHLKRWRRLESGPSGGLGAAECVKPVGVDDNMYRHIGASFGPVPEDVRLLLSGQSDHGSSVLSGEPADCA